MKYLAIIASVFLCFNVMAQTSLRVEVSADTIGMEDAIKVTYKLSGAQAKIEILPWEDLQQISGPNISSSFSFVNGVSKQEYSESYILMPTQEGSIFIPSASVVVDGNVMETEPLELFVMPVPNYSTHGKPKMQSESMLQKNNEPKSKNDEAEYERLIKKRELAKKKKKF